MEEYDGDDLLDALESIPMAEEVTVDDLIEMGWYNEGEVVHILRNETELTP